MFAIERKVIKMADNKNNQNFGANDPTGITQAFGAIAGAICAGLNTKETSWWNQSKLSPIDDDYPLDVPDALKYKLDKYMSDGDIKKLAKWIALSFDYFDPTDVHKHPIKTVLDEAVDLLNKHGLKVGLIDTDSGKQIMAECGDGKYYKSHYKYPQHTTLFIGGKAVQIFDDRIKAKAALFKKLAEYAELGLNISQSKKAPFTFGILKPDGEKIYISIC